MTLIAEKQQKQQQQKTTTNKHEDWQVFTWPPPPLLIQEALWGTFPSMGYCLKKTDVSASKDYSTEIERVVI